MMSRQIVFVALVSSLTHATEINPISKVLRMLSSLQSTTIAQGSEDQKIYDKYAAFCQERSQNIGLEIKSRKANKESLKAAISEHTASMGALQAKIEDLSADISSDKVDLKAAAKLRTNEVANFVEEERNLKETTDSIERAISQFSKKNRASFLQVRHSKSVTEALEVMVQAMAMSTDDASRLTALVQQGSLENDGGAESDEDVDLVSNAPAAATHESHVGGVVYVLEGLYEKAESKLNKIREAEATARQNHNILKQSLEHEIAIAEQDMHVAKDGLAEAAEAKAVSDGDLVVTSADLEKDIASKEALHHECMNTAREFQDTVNARKATIGALTAAEKAINDMRDGAKQSNFAQVSFAQLTSRTQIKAGDDVVNFQVLHLLRKLSTNTKSAALAQLASRISSTLRLGSGSGGLAFDKVREMITNMVSNLEAEAAADASHKEYCDREMQQTAVRKQDTTDELGSLTTKSRQRQARSTMLKHQIVTLQRELALIAKARADAAQLRKQAHAVSEKSRVEMQRGLKGLKLALKILKQHYGNSLGAEGGIMSLLEVVEADFTQSMTELIANEDCAANYYLTETKRNFKQEIDAKERDLHYKAKEHISMDKSVAELTNDVDSVQSRLSAILEDDKSIKKSCAVVSLSYEGRKGRRQEELSGLKEALETLEGATLVQVRSSHKLRVVHPALPAPEDF